MLADATGRIKAAVRLTECSGDAPTGITLVPLRADDMVSSVEAPEWVGAFDFDNYRLSVIDGRGRLEPHPAPKCSRIN